MSFKKNTAVTGFCFGLVSSTDGSDITAGAPVGYYTLDGGAQAAIADTAPVHEGNGLWSVDLTAAEMNGDIVGLSFTHSSAISAHFTIKTATVLNSDLNDFDPVNDAVASVTLVDTTTTNTDMRGTDGANTVVPDNTTIAAIEVDTQNIQTRLPASLVAGRIDADANAISGDSVAADNLEAMFDGTGYNVATAPASRDQVGQLATGAASISTVAYSNTLTTGLNPTGVLANTFTRDGLEVTVEDDAGNLQMQHDFNVGENAIASNMVMYGRLDGNGDILPIEVKNWVDSEGGPDVWDQIGTLIGIGVNAEHVFNLNIAHTGTGVNSGEIQIRGSEVGGGLSNVTLHIDQVYIAFSVISDNATILAIEVDTQDIQSRIPASLASGKMNSDMTAVAGNTSSATKLRASTQGIEATTVATSASTTEFTLTDGATVNDTYIGRSIIVTSDSATHGGEAQEITDYVGATKTVTVKTGFTTLLAVGDKVVIV